MASEKFARLQIRKIARVEVGDDVAEAVDVQDLPGPRALAGALRLLERRPQVVRR